MLLRMLGGWSLIVAIIALVWDATTSSGSPAGFVATSLGRHWFTFSQASLNLVQASLERYVHPFLWDPVLVEVLKLPTFVFFGAIGILLFVASRRRRKVNIYAN
jgi:hypothetical protein